MGALADASTTGDSMKRMMAMGSLDVLRGRYRKVVAAYFLAEDVRGWGVKLYKRAKEEFTFTITVYADDDLYPEVEKWLVSLLPEGRRRQLSVRTTRTNRSGEAAIIEPGGPRRGPERDLRFLYDSEETNTVRLDGFRVQINVTRPEIGSNDERKVEWARYKTKITLKAFSQNGQAAIEKHLRELHHASQAEDRQPRFHLASRWGGGWDRRTDVPDRRLDTVVVAEGQLERLVDAIETFRRSEKRYVDLGRPYHLGVLLTGPPGTGKTSIVRAIASHFGLDVYYMPLGEMDGDADLIRTVSYVQAGSLLLLEDADRYKQTSDDDDATGDRNASLSGMLNTLDGIATPHGLITFITANDRSKLDPALIRPGRVDVDEEIGYVDQSMLSRLAELVHGHPVTADPDGRELTPATVIAAMTSADTPEAAVQALDLR